jgi:hypothetical protein
MFNSTARAAGAASRMHGSKQRKSLEVMVTAGIYIVDIMTSIAHRHQ